MRTSSSTSDSTVAKGPGDWFGGSSLPSDSRIKARPGASGKVSNCASPAWIPLWIDVPPVAVNPLMAVFALFRAVSWASIRVSGKFTDAVLA
jgi:hypothetical protein